MNLIENEEMIQKKKKTKKIMIIIVALIALLLIICGVLLFLIYKAEKETLKLSIDNSSKSFASDLFVIEDGKVYVAIKDFGTLMGYTAYNGDYKTKYSEDTTKCYISNTDETASFSLNDSTMYKKATINEDYEYFTLDEPVRLINDKLYVISSGAALGTNSIIQYDAENNQISVLSLDYIVSRYSAQFPNADIISEDANFNNKKALIYGLVVVMSEDEHYGVNDVQGNEIIGAKYKSIVFKEESKEFTVTTDEDKIGILLSNGDTRIVPNYKEIKRISSELNYYLVKDELEKYGIINENGNTVLDLEYDQIGIDESKFNTNGIDNPYILFGSCVPVQQAGKWGIKGINKNEIAPVQYKEIGCTNASKFNSMGNNIVIIPKYQAIVLGNEEGKYGIISSSGEVYVPFMLDSVYSVTMSGQDQYYMTWTREEEQDGRTVKKTETYDLEQYFEQFVTTTTQEANQNTNAVSEATNEVADANAVTTGEQGAQNAPADAPADANANANTAPAAPAENTGENAG